MAPSSSAAATSVQVALRIRPTTQQDLSSIPARFQRTVIHAISSNAVAVDSTPSAQTAGSSGSAGPLASSSSPAKKQTFAFDQVLGPETSQYELYQSTAEPLISRFLEGFNCTILAYGQTSSGKTYSMTGVDLDSDPSSPHNGMGIIPRSISAIFSRAAALKEERGGAWTYSIKGSFIELYNEDLIDLLSYEDGAGGRREVQIREDKRGHIIWDGLREVQVRGTNEVMGLIRQGTAIRRTNETDMNSQSSRSHAIFSLTLTQRKFSGSGPPPRSTTPVPPGGRSPSRLARPVSQYSGTANRVSSPTFGRPATPSFASAMGRGGGLRPSSALGSHSTDGKARNLDEESGEWVTIVSKFHFVDLAGSERLKRTAAVGERIREGISINSGLLALGNVISALGDPSRAKSHTNSHIPYRDSKLTRLLQDSLGGNAHTLMIACVSSAEWNAAETVNTLKYANRARNIKNRAVVTEKEEGWDDLEWLQNTVTRLRKEVKSLKDGNPAALRVATETTEVEGSGKKVLAQMVELQSNYEDLRAKFVERTEELTRLRRELGEKHRNSSAGAISGTAKYEEIVGPVIEEYEKTISAMEAELSLNRAALRHTNDMVEEKEEELSQIMERHSATELYVEELKSRVGKLAEREASTEAYIRDLEEKIKLHEDTSMTSSESVSDLKKEIARYRDGEQRSQEYIAELEARLTRSDESVLSLRTQVERLEKESDLKREEVQVLQARLNDILNDGDSWRSDLEEREKRVRDLEAKMEEWQAKRLEASEERARLADINEEVQLARRSLEVDLKHVKSSRPASPVRDKPEIKVVPEEVEEDETALAKQYSALQETHAATLADLSSVSAKYRDALKEISELAGQINEIKLGSPSSRSESPERSPDTPQSVSRRRLGSRARELSESPVNGTVNGAVRRLFFRQAASAESLHSRSLSQSQSLSQELSSARSRMLSSPEINGYSGRRSPSGPRGNLSISLPIGPGHERSVASLEKEIMRLQEVLKDRESEISTLETTLKEKEKMVQRGSLAVGDIHGLNGHSSDLSPQIRDQIAAIRRSMEIRQPPSDLADENDPLDRLNELMLSMAQKEAQHREQLDELNEELNQVRGELGDELAKVRKQNDVISKLSRDQAINMSTELEALRSEHNETLTELETLHQREAKLLSDLNQLEEKHMAELKKIQDGHEQILRDKQAEVDSFLEKVKSESAGEAKELRKQLSASSEALEKSHQDHEEAFGKLKSEHEEELRRLKEDVDSALTKAKEEHDAALAKTVSQHEAIVKEKEETIHRTEEEFYTALTNLRSGHEATLAKQAAEADEKMERLKEDHANKLRMAEIAREGSLTESQSQQAELLKQLQDEHSNAMAKKEATFVEDLRKVKEEHAAILAKKLEDHSTSVERLKTKHVNRLAELEESKNLEIEALQQTLAATHKEMESSRSILQQEKEEALQNLREQHSSAISELENSHRSAVEQLKVEHDAFRGELEASHKDALDALLKEKTEEIAKLKADHQQVVTEYENNIIAARDQHRQDLENTRSQTEARLAEERQHIVTDMAEAESAFQRERDRMLKDHELLLEEVASYKAASDEYDMIREQTRQAHEAAMQEKDEVIASLTESVDGAKIERLRYESELEELRKELEASRSEQERLAQEVSRQDTIAQELEQHRTMLGDAQSELQKTKDHRDGLLAERSKQEAIVRDLQVQLSRAISVPSDHSTPPRPTAERNTSYSRVNGINKLPPLTPPPSVPPPPAPKSIPPVPNPVPIDVANSISSQSNTLRSSASSRESNPDSPATTAATSVNGTVVDTRLQAQLEEQQRHIEEQEVMIKTLNKQLTHCESDLQAHIDLVSTLETSLGDSEKNSRKARMQATEIARERDTLSSQIEKLRNELEEARRELVTARRSIAEEKQSLESRLDEERRARERVRQQLDMRVEELQQKKRSKFVCL